MEYVHAEQSEDVTVTSRQEILQQANAVSKSHSSECLTCLSHDIDFIRDVYPLTEEDDVTVSIPVHNRHLDQKAFLSSLKPDDRKVFDWQLPLWERIIDRSSLSLDESLTSKMLQLSDNRTFTPPERDICLASVSQKKEDDDSSTSKSNQVVKQMSNETSNDSVRPSSAALRQSGDEETKDGRKPTFVKKTPERPLSTGRITPKSPIPCATPATAVKSIPESPSSEIIPIESPSDPVTSDVHCDAHVEDGEKDLSETTEETKNTVSEPFDMRKKLAAMKSQNRAKFSIKGIKKKAEDMAASKSKEAKDLKYRTTYGDDKNIDWEKPKLTWKVLLKRMKNVEQTNLKRGRPNNCVTPCTKVKPVSRAGERYAVETNFIAPIEMISSNKHNEVTQTCDDVSVNIISQIKHHETIDTAKEQEEETKVKKEGSVEKIGYFGEPLPGTIADEKLIICNVNTEPPVKSSVEKINSDHLEQRLMPQKDENLVDLTKQSKRILSTFQRRRPMTRSGYCMNDAEKQVDNKVKNEAGKESKLFKVKASISKPDVYRDSQSSFKSGAKVLSKPIIQKPDFKCTGKDPCQPMLSSDNGLSIDESLHMLRNKNSISSQNIVEPIASENKKMSNKKVNKVTQTKKETFQTNGVASRGVENLKSDKRISNTNKFSSMIPKLTVRKKTDLSEKKEVVLNNLTRSTVNHVNFRGRQFETSEARNTFPRKLNRKILLKKYSSKISTDDSETSFKSAVSSSEDLGIKDISDASFNSIAVEKAIQGYIIDNLDMPNEYKSLPVRNRSSYLVNVAQNNERTNLALKKSSQNIERFGGHAIGRLALRKQPNRSDQVRFGLIRKSVESESSEAIFGRKMREITKRALRPKTAISTVVSNRLRRNQLDRFDESAGAGYKQDATKSSLNIAGQGASRCSLIQRNSCTNDKKLNAPPKVNQLPRMSLIPNRSKLNDRKTKKNSVYNESIVGGSNGDTDIEYTSRRSVEIPPEICSSDLLV